ncbi:hypothetical protein D3C87_1906160 [compost metagenome]
MAKIGEFGINSPIDSRDDDKMRYQRFFMLLASAEILAKDLSLLRFSCSEVEKCQDSFRNLR